MQGIFVPDEETPPEHLRRQLASARGTTVSVLNTGHIGYSPEQYFHTLVEYHDRFHPQLVVVNVCPNDFGDAYSVSSARGQWAEAKFWLAEIARFCHSRQSLCLLAASPIEVQMLGQRRASRYPGQVADLWGENNFLFLDLTDAFVDEHLRLMAQGVRDGRRPATSPLFNGALYDDHFSPRGAALWGRVVGRRAAELLDFQEAAKLETLRKQKARKP
jgi:hypothetical protein